MDTKYAPPERVTTDVILEQSRWFNDVTLLQKVLNCVPDIVFIVNDQRQIVFVNSSRYSFLAKIQSIDILGKRTGEVFDCEYSSLEIGGCGTSEFCRTCGAVNAILSSIKGSADEQECRITRINTHEALDLRVFTTPIVVNNTNFNVFAVSDISNEKRRGALERIFFHDILNTAGSLRGVSELLNTSSAEELNELKEILLDLSNKIIEEILTQKELSAAETNELVTLPVLVNSKNILETTINSFSKQELYKDIKIEIKSDFLNFDFVTDIRLLRRVILNLVKNALEASFNEKRVVINATRNENTVEFSVWNNFFIPKSIQNQIFHRSFSTKGEDRGLGTYSIKLLTEKYLKGKVGFFSSEKEGTLFTIVLPTELL